MNTASQANINPGTKANVTANSVKIAKPQHTKGDWKVMMFKGSIYITSNPFEDGEGRIQIAQLTNLKGRQRHANANLIAAAPELLAALQIVINHPSLKESKWGPISRAKHAIAAATLA